MISLLVGLDAGNYEVKISGPLGHRKFRSALGEWRDRRLRQSHGSDDIEWAYNGKRGFAGTLALYESEFVGSMLGDSKAHEDALLRTLIALHLYGAVEYQIVTGTPIDRHTDDEKRKIIDQAKGKHEITVNGDTRVLYIRDVRVAPEGGAAYWSDPTPGLVRLVDVGSGTVNLATLIDGRYVDRDSQTLRVGTESTKSRDLSALARAIVTHTSGKWDATDRIRIAGGAAEAIRPHIQGYYVDSQVLKPLGSLSSSFANSCGFYAIAQRVFGK